MKNLRLLTICTTLLLSVVLFITLIVLPKAVVERGFIYKTSNGGIKLNTWYEESSHTFYLFIPSFVEIAELEEDYKNDITLRDPDSGIDVPLADCKERIKYEIILDKSNRAPHYFCIIRLSCVPVFFVNTKSGTTKKIHNDKNYKEEVSINAYYPNGSLFLDSIPGRIKGRGASTWNQPKKSYVLSTSDSLNLFDFGNAIKWNLLSNSYDESNLRNRIVFGFAKQLGLSSSPDCEYVDLFLNGEYVGLYLLTEKVEFGENRIDAPAFPSYLFTLTSESQSEDKKVVFYEESGVRIALSEPEMLSDDENQYLQVLLKDLDSSLLDGHQSNVTIDTTTWALTYLVDELFANSDANYLSSYFYTYGDCSTFYRGPVWDYDQSMGNNVFNENPKSFLALKWRISSSVETPYYWELMKDSIFYNTVKNEYIYNARPIIDSLCSHGIAEYNNIIHFSNMANSLRWYNMYKSIELLPWRKPSGSMMDIKKYLSDRICFLDSAWVDDVNYHIVLLEVTKGEDYKVLTIKDGDYIDPGLFDGNNYNIRETGEAFNSSDPITMDLELVMDTVIVNGNFFSGLLARKTLLISGLLLLVFGGFFVVLFVRNCSDID